MTPLERAILTRPWHPRHVRHCCFCAAPLPTSTPQGGALALVCASAVCQAERRREVDRRHAERHRDRRREHWRALRRREAADPVTAERNRRRSREAKRRLAGMTPERAAELDRLREACA